MYDNPTTESITAMKATAFAHFSALGTWSKSDICNVCGESSQSRIAPLLVQWEPSSQEIGDFSWDGPFGYICVVKTTATDYLHSKGFMFDSLNVEYVAPETTNSHFFKCVPFPYTGPDLVWCCCNQMIALDMKASNVSIKNTCKLCMNTRYTFKYKDVTISRHSWHGEKMFRITTNGKSAATFVTEEGRKIILEAGFTNIAFSNAGEIVD